MGRCSWLLTLNLRFSGAVDCASAGPKGGARKVDILYVLGAIPPISAFASLYRPIHSFPFGSRTGRSSSLDLLRSIVPFFPLGLASSFTGEAERSSDERDASESVLRDAGVLKVPLALALALPLERSLVWKESVG